MNKYSVILQALLNGEVIEAYNPDKGWAKLTEHMAYQAMANNTDPRSLRVALKEFTINNKNLAGTNPSGRFVFSMVVGEKDKAYDHAMYYYFDKATDAKALFNTLKDIIK